MGIVVISAACTLHNFLLSRGDANIGDFTNRAENGNKNNYNTINNINLEVEVEEKMQT